jgi:hypothetical protein
VALQGFRQRRQPWLLGHSTKGNKRCGKGNKISLSTT